MKRNRFFIFLALAVLSVCLSSCFKEVEKYDIRLGLALNAAEVNDKGFNASLVGGARACNYSWGMPFNVLYGEGSLTLQENIRKLVSEDYNLILVSATGEIEAFLQMVKQYPQTNFILVDEETALKSNLQLLLCKAEQSAYLIGYLSAWWSHNKAPGNLTPGTIGFVGGMDIEPVDNIRKAYANGAAYYDSVASVTTTILESYTSFEDVQASKEAADSMYVHHDASLIYAVAGRSEEGVFQSAKANGIVAVGSDTDAAKLYPEYASCILTSNIKAYTDMIYQVVSAIRYDGFSSARYVGTLANECVGLADLYNFKNQIPDTLFDELNALALKIRNGSIDPLK